MAGVEAVLVVADKKKMPDQNKLNATTDTLGSGHFLYNSSYSLEEVEGKFTSDVYC